MAKKIPRRLHLWVEVDARPGRFRHERLDIVVGIGFSSCIAG